MMITVNLYYTGENGNARRFAEEMESGGTADKIRAEEGNVRYEYFFPMKDPETVLLIDAWEAVNEIVSILLIFLIPENLTRLLSVFPIKVPAEESQRFIIWI